MPSLWRVNLSGPDKTEVTPAALQAVVSGWLDAEANHKAGLKYYSAAPPQPRQGGIALSLGLVDDERLVPRLLDRVSEGLPIRLGRHHFRVAAAPSLVHSRSWAEMLDCPAPRPKAWWVTFTSPTTFRNGTHRRSSPWISPESVLRSVYGTVAPLGQPLGGPSELVAAARSVWVSDFEGRSEAFELPIASMTRPHTAEVVCGFVGRVRYVAPVDTDQAALVTALFRVAPYSGVGSHRGYGLGQVLVEEERPHSVAPPQAGPRTATPVA